MSSIAADNTDRYEVAAGELLDAAASAGSLASLCKKSPSETSRSEVSARLARARKAKLARARVAIHRNAAAPTASSRVSRHLEAPESPSSAVGASSIATSASSRRTIRSRARANRIAGGAAAKLMLQGPNENQDEDKYGPITANSSQEEELIVSAGSSELDEMREKVKMEFTVGPNGNRRYNPPAVGTELPPDEAVSEASLPSILNRSELFHVNATSAILALLEDKKSTTGTDKGTDTANGVSTAERQKTSQSATRSATSSTVFSRPQTEAKLTDTRRSSDFDPSFEYVSKTPSKPLLPPSAERVLEKMRTDMVDPNKTLGELLQSIASPKEGLEKDRGYMTRRKNACGALRVLTSDDANRKTICWTVGVLPALSAVLQDTGSEGSVAAFPDAQIRREYIEARKRAIVALGYLCTPKANRIPIFHCPGMVQAIRDVIMDDNGETRQGCCNILAYLAKTPENRLLLVSIPGLIDAVKTIIKPDANSKVALSKLPKRFVWEANSEADESSSMPLNSPTDSLTTMESGGFTVKYSDVTGITSRGKSVLEDDDSDRTPQTATSPSSVATRLAAVYDGDANTYIHPSRQFVFALLLHLLKEKDNAYKLARNADLVTSLVEISKLHDSPSHVHSLRILAHMTRHRDNSKLMVFKYRIILPALVHATFSEDTEGRKHACFALQNLSQDKSCRQEVANTKELLQALCKTARCASDKAERLAAVSALKNLTDEPANLIPLTNTRECLATLMQLARGNDEDTTEIIQYQACDALSTLSHWIRKIATSGYTVDAVKQGLPTPSGMIAPPLKVVTWSQYT